MGPWLKGLVLLNLTPMSPVAVGRAVERCDAVGTGPYSRALVHHSISSQLKPRGLHVTTQVEAEMGTKSLRCVYCNATTLIKLKRGRLV